MSANLPAVCPSPAKRRLPLGRRDGAHVHAAEPPVGLGDGAFELGRAGPCSRARAPPRRPVASSPKSRAAYAAAAASESWAFLTEPCQTAAARAVPFRSPRRRNRRICRVSRVCWLVRALGSAPSLVVAVPLWSVRSILGRLGCERRRRRLRRAACDDPFLDGQLCPLRWGCPYRSPSGPFSDAFIRLSALGARLYNISSGPGAFPLGQPPGGLALRGCTLKRLSVDAVAPDPALPRRPQPLSWVRGAPSGVLEGRALKAALPSPATMRSLFWSCLGRWAMISFRP